METHRSPGRGTADPPGQGSQPRPTFGHPHPHPVGPGWRDSFPRPPDRVTCAAPAGERSCRREAGARRPAGWPGPSRTTSGRTLRLPWTGVLQPGQIMSADDPLRIPRRPTSHTYTNHGRLVASDSALQRKITHDPWSPPPRSYRPRKHRPGPRLRGMPQLGHRDHTRGPPRAVPQVPAPRLSTRRPIPARRPPGRLRRIRSVTNPPPHTPAQELLHSPLSRKGITRGAPRREEASATGS